MRSDALHPDLRAASLLAQPTAKNEGKADHPIIAMDARASEKLPLREIPAMAARALQEQDVIVLHVLHPKRI